MAPDATAISARTAKFWVVFLMRLDGDAATMEKGIAWGRELKKEFIALDGVIATDMRLNQPGSINIDNDTHSVPNPHPHPHPHPNPRALTCVPTMHRVWHRCCLARTRTACLLLSVTVCYQVLPSQNEGCLTKLRDVKAKYDPTNLFCYASLSKK